MFKPSLKIKCLRVYVIALTLGIIATPAFADIYDVLRGTQTSANLNYGDLQGVAGAAAAGQAGAAGAQPGTQPAAATPQDTQPTTLREEAFKELLNKTFPLLPEQIEKLHKEYDRAQAAINATANAPPQPIFSTLTVDLSPGATPPIIRLATGFVSSMVFLDSTGQPWPVADYSLGNPTGFNIKWDNKNNTLFVQSLKDHISGNMAVRLANLDTPVMISIVTGQREVDYRIDLQVPGIGPNADAPVLESLPMSTSPSLLSALDGVPPTGSVELNVAKEYGRAWLYNGKLLFRTKLTLLSPAWNGCVSGPDGTRVYELMQTPLILAVQNGKTIKIELSGL